MSTRTYPSDWPAVIARIADLVVRECGIEFLLESPSKRNDGTQGESPG